MAGGLPLGGVEQHAGVAGIGTGVHVGRAEVAADDLIRAHSGRAGIAALGLVLGEAVLGDTVEQVVLAARQRADGVVGDADLGAEAAGAAIHAHQLIGGEGVGGVLGGGVGHLTGVVIAGLGRHGAGASEDTGHLGVGGNRHERRREEKGEKFHDGSSIG